MPSVSSFFTQDQQERIVSSIVSAEQKSSAEIRVHIEDHCPIDVLDRASQVFAELGMHKTSARNGVLVYVALKDHKTAIIGDIAVNDRVPQSFWDGCYAILAEHFKNGRFTEGICDVIDHFGNNFGEHFPVENENKNELSNEISFGE